MISKVTPVDFSRPHVQQVMWVVAGNFLFRYRNALFPAACLMLLLPGAEVFDDPLLAALVGAALAALGQFFRAMTIGLRYVVRGGRNRRVYAEDLVTDGVYAHTRNPMYVGNILIVCGVAVASNSWTTLVVGLSLALFMYGSIVAAEETFLREKFGAAYIAYCADVPRWLPNLRGILRTLSSMQFRWRRLVVKEYGTPFGWINVLAAVALYNLWHAGEWQTRHGQVSLVGWTMGVTTLLWFIAWRLKKSRTLLPD